MEDAPNEVTAEAQTDVAAKEKPKVTVQQALAMNQACVAVLSGPIAVTKKFAWALMRNRDRTQPILDNYDRLRRELIDKHAEKKEDGSLSTDEAGNAKFKDFATREKFTKEHQEIMELDAAVEWYNIPFEIIPESIAASVLSGIEPAVTGFDDDAKS